jgi:hypothetical protein
MLRHSSRAVAVNLAVTAMMVLATSTQAQSTGNNPNIYGMLPLNMSGQGSQTNIPNLSNGNGSQLPNSGQMSSNGAGAMGGLNNQNIQQMMRGANGTSGMQGGQGANTQQLMQQLSTLAASNPQLMQMLWNQMINGMGGTNGSPNSQMMQQMKNNPMMVMNMVGSRGGSSAQQQMLTALISQMQTNKNTKKSGPTNTVRP